MEEWFNNNQTDPEFEECDTDNRQDQSKRLFVKLGALVALLAFLAFAYAWLPLYYPFELDFLGQNQTLSEDELVCQSKPAVVNIHGFNPGDSGITQGTGFNLDPSGILITNRHVVDDVSSVEVVFSNDNRFFSKDIEFIDNYDLAVIRLQGENLPCLPLVSSQMVEKGQTVTIIGNPRGFQGVSARGQVESFFKAANDKPVFVIDAAIAPGSSGSPVLDEKGSLVGIVYAIGIITIDGREHKRALAIPASALPAFKP